MPTRAIEEVKCLDLELNVLMSIEDVTGACQRRRSSPGSMPPRRRRHRRAVMNTIEKESLDKTGLRSDVVTLYQGGQYHLYRYKKYTDVRLVFAPEKAIAFFGGDPDNFEYPRYDLDICFFRVYEDGKPAKIEHFLRWSEAGAGDGELVFVSGHPGRTDRLNTVQHLEFLRDRVLPVSLNLIRRREVLLKTFGDRSHENARQAEDDLFSYQNSPQGALGQLAGLQDPRSWTETARARSVAAAAVMKDPKLKKAAGTAWDEVGTVELPNGPRSTTNMRCWSKAKRLTANCSRSPARWCDSPTKRPSPMPIGCANIASRISIRCSSNSSPRRRFIPTLENAKLADSLGMYIEKAGADDPLVHKVMAGKSPQARAAELIASSNLADVAHAQAARRGRRERHRRSQQRSRCRAGAAGRSRRPGPSQDLRR